MPEKLPDGGTVVPLLIGIDKTVLTASWAVKSMVWLRLDRFG
jgi:hypothetical protein